MRTTNTARAAGGNANATSVANALYERTVRPHIEAGSLVPVLERYSEPFPGFFLYFPRRRHRSAALRALIDFVRSELRV